MNPGKKLPESIIAAVENALGFRVTTVETPQGGTWKRTFIAGNDDCKFIVRTGGEDSGRVPKAVAVQKKAAEAGVKAPRILAEGRTNEEAGGIDWCVEEYVQGTDFSPPAHEIETRKNIAAEMGLELKKLHSVRIDGFGALTGDLGNAKQNTFDEWINRESEAIDNAVGIMNIDGSGADKVRKAYSRLADTYDGSACLCHGDFACDNLLVRDGRLVAIIDWDNALACDGAHDFAYAHLWHRDDTCLDAMIDSYGPPDNKSFRTRVLDHIVVLAVSLGCWFHGRGEQWGVEWCRNAIEKHCL